MILLRALGLVGSVWSCLVALPCAGPWLLGVGGGGERSAQMPSPASHQMSLF